MTDTTSSYPDGALPDGIRTRAVPGVNGLNVHLLEAGSDDPDRPCLLLLHGFPEIAYSWRNVMLPLADAGYYVVAPDQRGYGHTTGANADYDVDLREFGMLNLVRDIAGLLAAIGRDQAAAVIGHDFGSPVAAWAALIRPDIFRSAVMMSGPFAGPPPLQGVSPQTIARRGGIDDALAQLDPPRKHYHTYYNTRLADPDMRNAPQGVHDFLRAYYHMKSADWTQNQPHPLSEWSAEQLAQLPHYYVMPLRDDMPAAVAPEMPDPDKIAACEWLPDSELAVYADAYQRNGFQGGLNWYRAGRDPASIAQLQLFHGRTIDVPTAFIGGAADWGVRQTPQALDRMPQACTNLHARHLVPAAGHWVQQEQPDQVVAHLLDFLNA